MVSSCTIPPACLPADLYQNNASSIVQAWLHIWHIVDSIFADLLLRPVLAAH
jgi:hypothetical protein